jgi:alginate O-acetyltransferase complex protein AlgI
MQFNSLAYFIFFAAVSLLYFLLPHRFRWVILLAANYIFYAFWRAEYVLLLFSITAATYLCAILISRCSNSDSKKYLLVICIVINLCFLLFFKYLNFICSLMQGLMNYASFPWNIPVFDIILPIGISFYMFRAVSYIIDVYRGCVPAERHFGYFAVYVSFFPSLLAGPIDRAQSFIPQVYKTYRFDVYRTITGLQLIGWGLFKKVVIADRLALYVDSIFNNIAHHSGPSFVVAAYFYSFQIYCDFSGYSDIAIGCGRILGFDLMQNFNLPYFSMTIADFWRRWHISLSTWFRDYLYIPLGGNRKGTIRTYVNLLITMLIRGLWHGAAGTFILWGFLHGLMLCMSRLTLKFRDNLYSLLGVPLIIVRIIRTIITYHIICLLWVFFRANSVADGIYIIKNIFHGWPTIFIDAVAMSYGILGIFILLFIQMVQLVNEQKTIDKLLVTWPPGIRWAFYYIVIFSIILLGVDGKSQFIYFQF